MAKKQRDTFAKREKERARREKQEAKRARRQGMRDPDAVAREATLSSTWGEEPVEHEDAPAAPSAATGT
jgi:predicted Zn-dependent peptidase